MAFSLQEKWRIFQNIQKRIEGGTASFFVDLIFCQERRSNEILNAEKVRERIPVESVDQIFLQSVYLDRYEYVLCAYSDIMK